jgi:hypothetical protein
MIKTVLIPTIARARCARVHDRNAKSASVCFRADWFPVCPALSQTHTKLRSFAAKNSPTVENNRETLRSRCEEIIF